MSVLVDSSVWIQAQNPKCKECLELKRMIKNNELIYITDFIQIEVSQGAKTEELFYKLWDSFIGFPKLSISEEIWLKSALNYYKCRKKGKTTSTIDCLIATLSKEFETPLWSADKGLNSLSDLIGFEIFKP